MMGLPKIRFVINENADADMITGRMDKSFFTHHPELEEQIKDMSKEDKKRTVTRFVAEFYSKNAEVLEDSRRKLQSAWDPVNDRILERLAEIIGTGWYDENITGIMTLNLVCPRNLRDSRFFVSYFKDTEIAKGIALHEITHFLFFKKWKEVFEDYDEKQFEYPNLVWNLSEIVVEPIDNDKELRKLVPKTLSAYKSYHNIIVPGSSVDIVEHFSNIYTKNTSSEKDFADFLRVSYKEIVRLHWLFDS
jgi:hypothetical protein